MLSVGSIVEGAFRLLRERPAAVAIWGLLYLAATILMSLAMRPLIAGQMAAIGAGGGQAAPAGMAAMMGRMVLVQLAFFVLFVMLMTAAQRAVLRPGEQGFAYVRLGMDELRMIGLSLLLLIGFYIAFIVAGLAVALLAAALGLALGAGAGTAAGFVLFLVLIAAIIWLEVRLSLAFPLTVARRRIVIGEAWRLSRGRFWTLFGGYLIVFLITLLILIVASLATTGSYFADIIANSGNPEAMQAAMRAQLERQFGAIDAMTILGWVVGAAAGAITIALIGGAVASAARTLIADQSVADTFA